MSDFLPFAYTGSFWRFVGAFSVKSSVNITFFTVANEKHRYRAWLLVLWLCLSLAFTADVCILWMHEGGASSTFAVRCSVTCQWYVLFDADLWLPGLSSCDWQSCSTWQSFSSVIADSRSRVFRCPSCGQYCPFDDTSLELDWCFGNSISYLEILLQSEYQSILFQWNTQQ